MGAPVKSNDLESTENDRNRGCQFSLRALLATGIAMALFCGGFRACFINPRLPKVVADPSDFPVELTEFLEEAEEEQIEVTLLSVLRTSSFLREDYHWQTDASPELIDLATRLWEMKPTAGGSAPVQTFWEYWPSRWARPECKKPEFLISSYWWEADWGVMAMHDTDNHRLYFWLIHDF